MKGYTDNNRRKINNIRRHRQGASKRAYGTSGSLDPRITIRVRLNNKWRASCRDQSCILQENQSGQWVDRKDIELNQAARDLIQEITEHLHERGWCRLASTQ